MNPARTAAVSIAAAVVWASWCSRGAPVLAARQRESLPALTDTQLLTSIQRRAVRFFWEKSSPRTGLTNDRASNHGPDTHSVSSIASTGYAMAALPIAVERRWIPKTTAYRRALATLLFLRDRMPHKHGWYYHFVNRETGSRAWKSELSSIDSALLLVGALVCGRYWPNTRVERLANALFDRVSWTWMRTNGGAKPRKLTLSHGWTPEKGFIPNDWDRYCELMLLYLPGLGANRDPLPRMSWDAWRRIAVEYGGMRTLEGGPLFMHQMAQGYFNFKNHRDRMGWDYWVSSLNATRINRQYCLDRVKTRGTYAPYVWGLSACDGPDGYRAYGGPGEEDGTISSTAALASISFTPEISKSTIREIVRRHGRRLWGRYGLGNAFNVDRDWFDKEVIGIDLGMALLAVENSRTGLIWKLLADHPAVRRGWARAGFHRTIEKEPRILRREPDTRGVSGQPSGPVKDRSRALTPRGGALEGIRPGLVAPGW